jgi:hypothetical protein
MSCHKSIIHEYLGLYLMPVPASGRLVAFPRVVDTSLHAFRSLKMTWSGNAVVVKISFESSSNALPVSPGARFTSRLSAIFESTVRSSIIASCLPIQPYLPIKNGKKADLLRTNSGWVVHRSGMNSFGLAKALGAREISEIPQLRPATYISE